MRVTHMSTWWGYPNHVRFNEAGGFGGKKEAHSLTRFVASDCSRNACGERSRAEARCAASSPSITRVTDSRTRLRSARRFTDRVASRMHQGYV